MDTIQLRKNIYKVYQPCIYLEENKDLGDLYMENKKELLKFEL